MTGRTAATATICGGRDKWVSTKSQPHTLCTHDRKDWCHSYKLWWAGQIGVNKVTTTNIMHTSQGGLVPELQNVVGGTNGSKQSHNHEHYTRTQQGGLVPELQNVVGRTWGWTSGTLVINKKMRQLKKEYDIADRSSHPHPTFYRSLISYDKQQQKDETAEEREWYGWLELPPPLYFLQISHLLW